MAQAQMQKAPAATKQMSSAPAGQPMAGSGGMQPSMDGKKMTWWMWLIIAIVVIGAGVGIYYWLK